MANNSLIYGKTWYWRTGGIPVPIGSDPLEIWELCLPVTEEETQPLLQELQQNGLKLKQKQIWSSDPNLPKGTLVVYLGAGDISYYSEAKRDQLPEVVKLKEYIQKNDGKIFQGPTSAQKPVKKSFFSFFRRHGRG